MFCRPPQLCQPLGLGLTKDLTAVITTTRAHPGTPAHRRGASTTPPGQAIDTRHNSGRDEGQPRHVLTTPLPPDRHRASVVTGVGEAAKNDQGTIRYLTSGGGMVEGDRHRRAE